MGVLTDRKRFGTGNKGVAFHCADCGKDGAPGVDRFFDNKEQKPKPLCVECMMARAKNEANALPLDSLIALNKEILDELRAIREILKNGSFSSQKVDYWMVSKGEGNPVTQVEEAF